MASLIGYIIPTQKFETIRDAIGVIIATELSKQKTLTSNTLFDAPVFVERFIPLDITEMPSINVYFDNVNYTMDTPVSNTGEMVYKIDVTTKGVSSSSKRGDLNAAQNLHKLMGVIRAILMSGEYRFLGLSQGVVQRRNVESMQVGQPKSVNDCDNVISGQLTLKVRCNETNADLTGIVLTDVFTNYTIDDSGKGYKILITNS